MGSEHTIVGTLLVEYAEPLGANIKRMLLHAPQSFVDQALGVVAEAVRETALAGEPVAEQTVLRRLETRGTLTTAGGALALARLAGYAVSNELAELDAQELWQRYKLQQSL